MKKLFILITIAAGCIFSDAFNAYSQNRRGVVTASSTVITRTRIQKERKKMDIKWQHNIDATITNHYQLTYTGGWRFGNFFFLGFGTGLQVYPNVLPWGESETHKAEFSVISNSYDESLLTDIPEGYYTYDDLRDKYHNPSRIAVPLYLHTKFRFMKTRVAPFLSASGGLMFNGYLSCDDSQRGYDSSYGDFKYDRYYKNGAEVVYYADIMLGIDIRFRNESSLTIGVGPIFTGQDDDYPSIYYLMEDLDDGTAKRASAGIRLGYSF